MKTYKELFADLDRPALIPFFVVGDPTPDESLTYITTAVDAGADVLELGIPFSDPIADGPTIQKADIRALEQGITCRKAFEIIRNIKDYKDIPIGLLMYYNLICNYGKEQFYQDAAAAGVNSILVADLNIDDADEVTDLVKAHNMDSVYMVTPITSDARREKIARLSTGFIYTVTLLGVTGTRDSLSEAAGPMIASLKKMTQIPVCVGFGVSKPDHAAELARAGADGVIVGSAIVKIIENNLENPDQCQRELKSYIESMRNALQDAAK